MGLSRLRACGRTAALTGVAVAIAGCGSSHQRGPGTATTIPRTLVEQARPIGRGPAFHPPVRGRPIGRCTADLGPRFGVHVELFAANRVVLIAAGIGTRPPVRRVDGRIVAARCFGALVTRDPTGIVLVRRGARLTVGQLMRSWGQPLTSDGMLTFRGTVTAYVDGRRWTSGSPRRIPLARHSEIVLEVGPHVPPHRSFVFPAGL